MGRIILSCKSYVSLFELSHFSVFRRHEIQIGSKKYPAPEISQFVPAIYANKMFVIGVRGLVM